MKTAGEVVDDLAAASFRHGHGCRCHRCRHGKEVFLVASDVLEIRKEVLTWVQTADSLAVTQALKDIQNLRIPT
jgi:hypothetical protein